jgi:hypothetical protein
MAAVDIRSRIVGHGEEAPDQLLANPANWRIHPKAQQDAMKGILDQVGWVQSVIVNRTTGHLVDGHLRVSLALREDLPTIPVAYVELTPEEEALVLATLDPLAALAVTDKEKLAELLAEVSVKPQELGQMLDSMAGISAGDLDSAGNAYTAEVNVPQYEITGERPNIEQLYDDNKASALRAAVESANIPQELKQFLIAAAGRHIVFDYSKIAEYYAHASADVQRLFEESALVVIDFDDAIKGGYVRLGNTIDALRDEDANES